MENNVSASETILETLIDFFTQDDWSFVRLQEQPVLRMNFQGDNGQWNCIAQAREAQNQFVFYSICPINAPAEKRLAVAEFITRANDNLIVGNFELDFSDGQIRYKTSIDIQNSRLDFVLIKPLVYVNVLMMDRYLPGIMAVIYGRISPAEAIAQIEE